MKTKNKLRIEKSKFPIDNKTYILWLETESVHGAGYRGIYFGSYKECKAEKKRLEKEEKKAKVRKRGILAWMH